MPDEINPIEQTPPRAVIVLTWLQNGTVNVAFPNDEVVGRFLMDKGCEAIKAEYQKRNVPMVLPAHGLPSAPPRRMFG
jgi:hypothetical protein